MNLKTRLKIFIYRLLHKQQEPDYFICKLNDYCFVVNKKHRVVFMSKNDADTIQWAIDNINNKEE